MFPCMILAWKQSTPPFNKTVQTELHNTVLVSDSHVQRRMLSHARGRSVGSIHLVKQVSTVHLTFSSLSVNAIRANWRVDDEEVLWFPSKLNLGL